MDEKELQQRHETYQVSRIADFKLQALSNRVHLLERVALPALLSSEKTPASLKGLYDLRSNLLEDQKALHQGFEKEFPIPGPGDWTFDPIELRARIARMRERFLVEGDSRVLLPSGGGATCPTELVKLSAAFDKMDFPNEVFDNDGSAFGSFTFDPNESVQFGVVRFSNDIHDGGAFYDDPLNIGDPTRLATSTMLEFSLFKDWEASCAFDTIRWEVEITAQLSVSSSNTDDFFCFTDAGVHVEPDPNAPPPAHFVEFELHPLLSLNIGASGQQASTTQVLSGSITPTNPITTLRLAFATFNLALNGDLEAKGSFKIRPTLGSFDYWGVSYIVFNA